MEPFDDRDTRALVKVAAPRKAAPLADDPLRIPGLTRSAAGLAMSRVDKYRLAMATFDDLVGPELREKESGEIRWRLLPDGRLRIMPPLHEALLGKRLRIFRLYQSKFYNPTYVYSPLIVRCIIDKTNGDLILKFNKAPVGVRLSLYWKGGPKYVDVTARLPNEHRVAFFHVKQDPKEKPLDMNIYISVREVVRALAESDPRLGKALSEARQTLARDKRVATQMQSWDFSHDDLLLASEPDSKALIDALDRMPRYEPARPRDDGRVIPNEHHIDHVPDLATESTVRNIRQLMEGRKLTGLELLALLEAREEALLAQRPPKPPPVFQRVFHEQKDADAGPTDMDA